MSRSRSALLAITAAAAVLAATPADAQPEPPPSAETMIEKADEVFTADTGSPCRPSSTPGEIVVCGEDDGADQRIFPPSTSTDTGIPRAPDLMPRYPGIVVARGCFIPPCPPPQPLIIDIDAIPKAPPGSDADLIGRGELRAD